MKWFPVCDIETCRTPYLHDAYHFVEGGGSKRDDSSTFYRGDTGVELDTALTAAATLAWLRTQGHPGIEPRLASFALLQWWARHGAMTSPNEQRLQLALNKLQIDIGQASLSAEAAE